MHVDNDEPCDTYLSLFTFFSNDAFSLVETVPVGQDPSRIADEWRLVTNKRALQISTIVRYRLVAN